MIQPTTALTVRQKILIALDKYGEQTAKEVTDNTEGLTNKQVCNNLGSMFIDLLVTRRRGEGSPEYKITPLGKSRIGMNETAAVDKIIELSVNKAVLTTASVVKPVPVVEPAPVVEPTKISLPVKNKVQDKANAAIVTAAKIANSDLTEIAKLKAEIAQLKEANEKLNHDLISANSAAQLSLEQTRSAENRLLALLHNAPKPVATMTPSPIDGHLFLVRASNRDPQIVKSREKAEKLAEIAIQKSPRVEIFALSFLGRASRGIKWD